jgi:hypothetical protein
MNSFKQYKMLSEKNAMGAGGPIATPPGYYVLRPVQPEVPPTGWPGSPDYGAPHGPGMYYPDGTPNPNHPYYDPEKDPIRTPEGVPYPMFFQK